MNFAIEDKLQGTGWRRFHLTGAFAILTFIIVTTVTSWAEISLRTVTFSAPSATDRNLTADFSLPDRDSVSEVKIDELPHQAVSFTPANQLTDYRCAVLLVIDQTLGSVKQFSINAVLANLFGKGWPASVVNYVTGLATTSGGELQFLLPPSEQTPVPTDLKLDGKSRLSYSNIEEAVRAVRAIQANRYFIVVYTTGDLDDQNSKQAEVLQTALADQVQICVVAVESPARSKSRTINPEFASQSGGIYLEINRKTVAETNDRLSKFFISGGRISADLGQLTLPATLHFQLHTIAGKTYGFTHQVDNIVPATTPTPQPPSPVTPVPVANPTPVPSSTVTLTPTKAREHENLQPAYNKRLIRYIVIGEVIAAITSLAGLLGWLITRAIRNRFDALDKSFVEKLALINARLGNLNGELSVTRNTIDELAPVIAKRADINVTLTSDLARVTEELTNAKKKLLDAEEQKTHLDNAKRTMVALSYGLWELRRFLVLPGETMPNDSFDGDCASEMFSSLQNTLALLEAYHELCVVDKTGSPYIPSAVEVVGRRIRNDLATPRVAYTEKPEVSWNGVQLARASVSLEIPPILSNGELPK